MANTSLIRTPSSASNQKTYTISTWFKLSSIASNGQIFGAKDPARTSNDGIWVLNTGKIMFYIQGVTVRESTQVLRDFNAWYHVVASVDTTQATASNRLKIYLNGQQITSFSISADPTQNVDTAINGTNLHNIGQRINDDYFNGSMSHFHFIDGIAYDATAFGETDTTTGEWKANTSPSVTYGTNGFFILKDGNGITDQSGEGNDFTLGSGTLIDLKDNPDNTFVTMNPLDTFNSPTITNGNTVINAGASDKSLRSTLGFSQGKYYWEVKIIPNNSAYLGIINSEKVLAVGFDLSVASTNSVIFEGNGGGISKNGSSVGSYTGGAGIYGFAFDLDAGTLKLSKDGVFFNSGNAVVTGISADTYLPFFAPNGGGSPTEFQANFGNGYFGTTAVASAGINASNNGIFEYDVPTGYTALSTKGLNL